MLGCPEPKAWGCLLCPLGRSRTRHAMARGLCLLNEKTNKQMLCRGAAEGRIPRPGPVCSPNHGYLCWQHRVAESQRVDWLFAFLFLWGVCVHARACVCVWLCVCTCMCVDTCTCLRVHMCVARRQGPAGRRDGGARVPCPRCWTTPLFLPSEMDQSRDPTWIQVTGPQSGGRGAGHSGGSRDTAQGGGGGGVGGQEEWSRNYHCPHGAMSASPQVP